MAERISEKYIGEFFGLTPDEEGKKELAEIKGKLKKMVFEHGHDIVTIDGDPDGMYFIESGTAVVLGREGTQQLPASRISRELRMLYRHSRQLSSPYVEGRGCSRGH